MIVVTSDKTISTNVLLNMAEICNVQYKSLYLSKTLDTVFSIIIENELDINQLIAICDAIDKVLYVKENGINVYISKYKINPEFTSPNLSFLYKHNSQFKQMFGCNVFRSEIISDDWEKILKIIKSITIFAVPYEVSQEMDIFLVDTEFKCGIAILKYKYMDVLDYIRYFISIHKMKYTNSNTSLLDKLKSISIHSSFIAEYNKLPSKQVRFCSNICGTLKTYKKCHYKNCTFAHYKSEFKILNCLEKNCNCPKRHSDETDDLYEKRIAYNILYDD